MKQLRGNIRRVAILMVALFVFLGVYGAYSLLTYGNRWFSSSANTFVRSQKKNVVAGAIIDKNGVVLAQTKDDVRVYNEDEDVRTAVVHVLGDSAGNVSNGVETFMASHLYGFNMSLWERLTAYLSGSKRTGDSVQLTIDSELSRFIKAQVAGNSALPQDLSGAVVVMNYQTGAVLASMSFPLFDPNDVTTVADDPGKPFYNRATQGLYAPGSTFKIITATAALSSGQMVGRSFQCTGQLKVDETTQHVITDAGTNLAENKLTFHGQIGLRDAFVKSCNNTFAQIALELGDQTIKAQSEAFGFNDNFLFRDIVVENSSYPSTNRTNWAIAWTGAGQSALLSTPLHMCMVAAAIGNDGVMMEPRMIEQVVSSAGDVRQTFSSKIYRTVSKDAAVIAQIKDYMKGVVNERIGTGQAASLNGYTVYGKTGSAEVDGQEKTNAWFVGFIGDDSAPYALSIVLENTGGGGEFAAPLAQKIFQKLAGQIN